MQRAWQVLLGCSGAGLMVIGDDGRRPGLGGRPGAAEECLGRGLISPFTKQYVDYLAVLIDGAVQVPLDGATEKEDRVDVPAAAKATTMPPGRGRELSRLRRLHKRSSPSGLAISLSFGLGSNSQACRTPARSLLRRRPQRYQQDLPARCRRDPRLRSRFPTLRTAGHRRFNRSRGRCHEALPRVRAAPDRYPRRSCDPPAEAPGRFGGIRRACLDKD